MKQIIVFNEMNVIKLIAALNIPKLTVGDMKKAIIASGALSSLKKTPCDNCKCKIKESGGAKPAGHRPLY